MNVFDQAIADLDQHLDVAWEELRRGNETAAPAIVLAVMLKAAVGLLRNASRVGQAS
jgi:hypothetical protein